MSSNYEITIPIYLVSLECDIDRRQELKARFPKSFSKFVHIKGVDGRLLSAKEYYDKTHRFYTKYKRLMSPAELGCTLSHIKALELFLCSDEDFALIIEDDIEGSDEDLLRINHITKLLDENSLLLCGGQLELTTSRYRLGQYINKSNVYLVSKFSHQFMYGTCCYVVSRKSAKEILKHHLEHWITLADKWDEFFKNSSTRMYFADILEHPSDLSGSHIEKDRTNSHRTLLNKLLSADLPYKIARRVYWELVTKVISLCGYTRI